MLKATICCQSMGNSVVQTVGGRKVFGDVRWKVDVVVRIRKVPGASEHSVR
jgi:hypothetical protein